MGAWGGGAQITGQSVPAGLRIHVRALRAPSMAERQRHHPGGASTAAGQPGPSSSQRNLSPPHPPPSAPRRPPPPGWRPGSTPGARTGTRRAWCGGRARGRGARRAPTAWPASLRAGQAGKQQAVGFRLHLTKPTAVNPRAGAAQRTSCSQRKQRRSSGQPHGAPGPPPAASANAPSLEQTTRRSSSGWPCVGGSRSSWCSSVQK